MALDVIPDLIRAGVACLKIEGRLKGPEYVAVTTAAYRQAVDAAWEAMGRQRAGEPDVAAEPDLDAPHGAVSAAVGAAQRLALHQVGIQCVARCGRPVVHPLGKNEFLCCQHIHARVSSHGLDFSAMQEACLTACCSR